jgi:hypothetical protein
MSHTLQAVGMANIPRDSKLRSTAGSTLNLTMFYRTLKIKCSQLNEVLHFSQTIQKRDFYTFKQTFQASGGTWLFCLRSCQIARTAERVMFFSEQSGSSGLSCNVAILTIHLSSRDKLSLNTCHVSIPV